MPVAWPQWNKVELPGLVEPKQSCNDKAALKTTLDFLIIYPTSGKFEIREAHSISWIQKTNPKQRPRAVAVILPMTCLHNEKLQNSRLLEKIMATLGYQLVVYYLDAPTLGLCVEYMTTVHVFHQGMDLPLQKFNPPSQPRGMGPDLVPYNLTPKTCRRRKQNDSHAVLASSPMLNQIGRLITTPEGDRDLLRADVARAKGFWRDFSRPRGTDACWEFAPPIHVLTHLGGILGIFTRASGNGDPNN